MSKARYEAQKFQPGEMVFDQEVHWWAVVDTKTGKTIPGESAQESVARERARKGKRIMSIEDGEKRFILWDKKDNFSPRIDDDGSITSDGVLGRVGERNVYLTTYAQYPGEKRPHQLEVGECIENVAFSLSGSRGAYDIYRVR